MLNPFWEEFLISGQHVEIQSFPAVTFVMILHRKRGIPVCPSVQQKPSFSLSLTHMQTNTHTPRPLPLSPLCPPLSCAICQGGREFTGGSFILALLTPCGDRCSWRPAELVRGWGGTQRRGPTSPHCHTATRDPQHVRTSADGRCVMWKFLFLRKSEGGVWWWWWREGGREGGG